LRKGSRKIRLEAKGKTDAFVTPQQKTKNPKKKKWSWKGFFRLPRKEIAWMRKEKVNSDF